MERGDLVTVKVYPDMTMERVVLEVHPTYVLACRPEVYDAVINQVGLPDQAMGFPVEDVECVIAASA